MKTFIKIATGIALLGLVSACNNSSHKQDQSETDAADEAVGEVGTLTDVPTDETGTASGDAVNGVVSTEPPGSLSTAPGGDQQPPAQSSSNPSPPASNSSPPK